MRVPPLEHPGPERHGAVVLVRPLVAHSAAVPRVQIAPDALDTLCPRPPAVTPESPGGAGKAREGKGNHPMKRACAEDAKRLCSDVKAGDGRIAQCLKEHAQELSHGCAEMIQSRGKHRQ